MDSLTSLIGEIETRDAIVYGAIALILLLQLRIAGRLRRLARLIEARPEPQGEAKIASGGPSARYMREDTMAEFQRLHEKDGR